MKKNLNWKTNKYSSFPKEKLAGTFLHPSSLPYGEFGIGDIGFSARKFANNFEDWGLSLWQMLPINLTDGHNSPYSSPCSFAGNPLLISLRDLVKADLLKKESLVGCQSQNSKVPFGKVKENKLPLISLAATNLSKSKNHPWKTELEKFCEENQWLRDAGTFFNFEPHHFSTCQFLFFKQFSELKKHCEQKNIYLMGDLPIYVSNNSLELKLESESFLLSEKGESKEVSGCPADDFNQNGQKWGHPLYDWQAQKDQDYTFWQKRLKYLFKYFHLLRLDHFRAFESYWSIPKSQSACKGRWQKGPGQDLFRILNEKLGALPLVVEDLGHIDQAVLDLKENLGFPGMAVFNFAFDGNPENPHLAENVDENQVFYSSTHDTNTFCGFWKSLDPQLKTILTKKERVKTQVALELATEKILSSKAKLCIFPMQDLLGLGSESRMNIPGTAFGNWNWRMTTKQLEASQLKNIKEKIIRNQRFNGSLN